MKQKKELDTYELRRRLPVNESSEYFILKNAPWDRIIKNDPSVLIAMIVTLEPILVAQSNNMKRYMNWRDYNKTLNEDNIILINARYFYAICF
jgi:hypothetical protein